MLSPRRCGRTRTASRTCSRCISSAEAPRWGRGCCPVLAILVDGSCGCSSPSGSARLDTCRARERLAGDRTQRHAAQLNPRRLRSGADGAHGGAGAVDGYGVPLRSGVGFGSARDPGPANRHLAVRQHRRQRCGNVGHRVLLDRSAGHRRNVPLARRCARHRRTGGGNVYGRDPKDLCHHRSDHRCLGHAPRVTVEPTAVGVPTRHEREQHSPRGRSRVCRDDSLRRFASTTTKQFSSSTRRSKTAIHSTTSTC